MAFLREFVLTVLCLAFAYAATVSIINPRRKFRSELFPEVVPNSRAGKIAMFEAYEKTGAVHGVVIGSSTSMQLNPQTLERQTGVRFFNFSVFAGHPEDYLAIYGFLRARNVPIERVILGMDLLAFDPNTQPSDDFSLNADLRAGLERRTSTALERLAVTAREYKETFGFSYAMDAFRGAKVAIRPVTPMHGFTPDGRVLTPLWDEQKAKGTVDYRGSVDRCSDRAVAAASVSDHLDPQRVQRFEALLQAFKRDGVAVTLWITPYHPDMFARIDRNPKAAQSLARSRQYIEEAARRMQIPLVDLNRAESFGGDPSSWEDCAHFGPPEADRIATVLTAHGV